MQIVLYGRGVAGSGGDRGGHSDATQRASRLIPGHIGFDLLDGMWA